MPSDLQITNIKDQANANSAITIASDGQITVNQNNPTITLDSNTTFPAGHVVKMSTVYLGTSDSDNVDVTGTAKTAIFNTANHVCDGGSSNNTTIYVFWDAIISLMNNAPNEDVRKKLYVTYTGATHSPTVTNWVPESNLGAYLNSNATWSERELMLYCTIPLPVVTISAAGTLQVKVEMENLNSGGRFVIYGNSLENRIRFVEVQ